MSLYKLKETKERRQGVRGKYHYALETVYMKYMKVAPFINIFLKVKEVKTLKP